MSRRICTRCMGQMIYEYATGDTPAEWACLACGHREEETPRTPAVMRVNRQEPRHLGRRA